MRTKWTSLTMSRPASVPQRTPPRHDSALLDLCQPIVLLGHETPEPIFSEHLAQALDLTCVFLDPPELPVELVSAQGVADAELLTRCDRRRAGKEHVEGLKLRHPFGWSSGVWVA